MQDSLDVFENPVDTVGRIALQDITSEQVTSHLEWTESFIAFFKLLNPEYVLLVVIAYQVVVVRLPFIKTNSKVKRNIAMGVLIVLFGCFGYFYRNTPLLNVLVTGMCVFGFYEAVFKGVFWVLGQWFKIPLPKWYVDELEEEKLRDIAEARAKEKPPTP
mgnify:CR=1 FL=1